METEATYVQQGRWIVDVAIFCLWTVNVFCDCRL